MATTAKQSSTNSTTSTSPSNVRTSQQNFQENGEEDIATIAKQISDHAEAIYQTWKARGLAPTEILNCHTDSSNAFSKTLSPSATGASSTGVGGIITNSNNLNTSVGSTVGGGGIVKSPAVAELLAQAPDLSNNNLEKLVSSFVNEDKARIAAQKQQQQQQQHSGIQYVRQKFERAGSSDDTVGNITTASPINTKSNYINRQINLNSNSNNVPDVLKDTIKEQKPYPKEKPQTPVKPEHLLNHVPTWPLKNRLGTNYQLSHQQQQQKNSGVNQLLIGDHSSEMKGQNSTGGAEISTGAGSGIGDGISNNTNGSDSLLLKNSHDLMDEVTREEERLINALKTGTVLNNDTTSLPEVIQSTLINNNNNNISDINERNNYNLQPDISSSTTNSNNLSNNNNNNNSILNNNIDSNNLNNNTTNTTSSTTNNQQVQIKQWNGVPMKPNHTPIILHPKEDTKTYTSFNKVATTRIPTRQEKQMLDESDSKKSFHIKTIPSPIRPFLSRGSVAERVLIFEKCPEKAPPRSTIKETKIQQKVVNKILPPQHSTLQRHLKSSAKNIYIPQFHFPHGKPPPAITTETTMQRLEQTFNKFPNFEISRDKFHMVVTMCQVPLYWRLPLYMCTPLSSKGMVNGNKFMDFWRQMTSFCHDSASRFIYILSRGNRQRPFILPEDLAPLIQDVVDTHPGLAFLKEAAEFHSRYVHTVIARIYYNVNRSWSGKITVPELRKSNLLEVIQLLEEEEDINQIMAYFSYEHFYVIYCKFWELDRDHDLYIDQKDLARHNDHALSSRMIERIFSGCVTRGPKTRNPNGQNNNPKMSYTEFVWFLLAEEDKSHATAIEYWFRCMDVDGDGILSMYELEYFYEEQQHRMDSIGIETLPFEDCLCQMLDMIKPITPGCVTLSDLKRCKMTPIFFDTFFNLEKYMEHEQRDPFAQRDSDDLSDWDRYAAQEYELLVAEEGGDTQGSYDEEDEYESNIDILESHIDDCILNEW